MNKIGNFSVIRLTEEIEITHHGKDIHIKSGSIGLVKFEPLQGRVVCFEGIPSHIMVSFNLVEDISEYVFKNIKSTVEIQHVRDDVEVVVE